MVCEQSVSTFMWKRCPWFLASIQANRVIRMASGPKAVKKKKKNLVQKAYDTFTEALLGETASEGMSGFLLPDGGLIDVGGKSHKSAAMKLDVQLDDLYDSGFARIYVVPGEEDGWFGIEQFKEPTTEQIATLAALAGRGNFARFVAEGAKDVSVEENITTGSVKKALEEAWGKKRFDYWYDAGSWEEQLHPRRGLGYGGGQFKSAGKQKPGKQAKAGAAQ